MNTKNHLEMEEEEIGIKDQEVEITRQDIMDNLEIIINHHKNSIQLQMIIFNQMKNLLIIFISVLKSMVVD